MTGAEIVKAASIATAMKPASFDPPPTQIRDESNSATYRLKRSPKTDPKPEPALPPGEEETPETRKERRQREALEAWERWSGRGKPATAGR